MTLPNAISVVRRRGDALPPLICYVCVLVGIPSALIVGPLGAAGTPAQILAFVLLCWWLISRVVGGRQLTRRNPVKWLMLVLAVAILASYVAGMMRPISYSTEVSSADRSLLSLGAWCGVVLVMTEGITTRRRLDTLLRVLAVGVTVIAVLGIVQFIFKIDLAHVIKYPGLKQNTVYGQLVDRSTFVRVTGTTNHPIEFGVVLSAALPLLFHFARFSETRRERQQWWVAVGLVGIALPMSVARSAMLGGLIAIVFLFHTWPSRLRVRVLIIGCLGLVAMRAAVPGLLGTIRGLFLDASSDPSTQGRTDDYGPVGHYFTEHPLFGRGIGTFIPSLYRTLDNAYLGLLVEAGIVGVLAFIALFVGTGLTAGTIRRRSTSESTKDLAQSLKAAVAVLAINAATFDALGFAMCAGMIFVYVGATGALWEIEGRDYVATSRPPLSERAWRQRMAAAAVAILALFAMGGIGIRTAKPAYLDYGALLADTPSTKGQPAFETTASSSIAVSLLRDVLRSESTRSRLAAAGASHYEVALKSGSVETDTDVEGDSSPVLYLETTAQTPEQAEQAFKVVYAEAQQWLSGAQSRLGLSKTSYINLRILQQTPAFPVSGKPTRAAGGLLLLFGVVAAAYYHVFRRRRRAPTPYARSPVLLAR